MTRTGRAGRKWLAGLLPLLLFFGATPAVAQHTVVGHSNTVPQLIAALGGPAVPPIADNEYDRLYVLTIDAAGTRVVASRY